MLLLTEVNIEVNEIVGLNEVVSFNKVVDFNKAITALFFF